ncbi:hypothetical protein NSK_006374 [Nannochloropsis salina CCMP1776]|uniref:Uncharacterized protein n=1 Tax=Nannochloropsis salina CCMP1776 TaxID=1027361 RepID=A0A4D9CUI6_9STRA|nr:hypothetical protein NSK_006374 [Nannochloropsis salina CCMP1776]|eukprot:TFJ82254.1 hypothetical protein NSK_006374 [Nannochloropsis salina CCMP1776]
MYFVRQCQHSSFPLFAATDQNEKESPAEKNTGNETGELRKLLTNDTKEKPLLVYLTLISIALLALGVGTYEFGGPLLGLGFSDESNFYFDAAPSYALLLVYPPLFLFFPEARNLLLKTLVVSFLITLPIYFFPYHVLGWEPTNEHVLITVAVPILSYLTFFSWRATAAYMEIVEEEGKEGKEP